MRLPLAIRKLHGWTGVAMAASLAAAAITGLLWAYAPYLYWQPGYLERKHTVAPPAFEAVAVSVPQAVAAARAGADDLVVTGVTVRAELGRTVYEVQGKRGGRKTAVLVDAATGERLSPLTPEQAVAIAGTYVAGSPPLDRVVLTTYTSRKSGKQQPGYRVTYRRAGDPEVWIDPDSGAVLEESDRTRRFHFAVMQLHQLNYFGFHKTLTIIPGLAIVVLLASGLAIWVRQRQKKRAAGAR